MHRLEEAIPGLTTEAERLRAVQELEKARHLVRLFSPETTEHIVQFLDANPDATAEDLEAELVRWDKET